MTDLKVTQRRRPTGNQGGVMKTSFDIVNYLAGMKNSILYPTDESSNHKLHEGPQVRCFRPMSAILINHHHSKNRGPLSDLSEVLYHFVVCSNVTSHHAFGVFFVVFRQIEDLISCRLGAVCRTPLVQGTGLQGSDRVMALKETTGNHHSWVSVAPFGRKKVPT